jgi:hypothetical protein
MAPSLMRLAGRKICNRPRSTLLKKNRPAPPRLSSGRVDLPASPTRPAGGLAGRGGSTSRRPPCRPGSCRPDVSRCASSCFLLAAGKGEEELKAVYPISSPASTNSLSASCHGLVSSFFFFFWWRRLIHSKGASLLFFDITGPPQAKQPQPRPRKPRACLSQGLTKHRVCASLPAQMWCSEGSLISG